MIPVCGGRTRLLGFQPPEVVWREAKRAPSFPFAPVSPQRTVTAKEVQPVCVMEMAASGMPVISTTHCDIPFVLGPSLEPYLAPENNIAALTAILTKIIEDWDLTLSNLQICRLRMEKDFNLVKRTLALANCYGGVIGDAN